MSIKGGGERVLIHSILAGLNSGQQISLLSEDFDTDSFEDFFGCKGLFEEVDRINYPPFKPLSKKSLLLYQRMAYHQKRIRKALGQKSHLDLVLGTQDIEYIPNAKVPVVQYCYFPEYFAHLEASPSSPLWKLYYGPASRFYRNRVERVDRILAVSDYTKNFITAKWNRTSETLYPPCPTEVYSSSENSKEDVVITVGRVVPEKRMHLFIEMARRLPRYRFVIIGSLEASGSAYYDSLKKDSPGNLSFVLSPLRKEIALLARAKVYVHCAMNEHFGITIVEAMAAGCVPVVHDSGGPREIVDSGVGFRWERVGDAVGQISKIMDDDDLRMRLSAASSAKAGNYSPEVFEAGLTKVFKEYQV